MSKKKKLEPEIATLLAFADGKAPNGFPGDLWGAAARAAAIPLLQDWQTALSYRRAGPLQPQDLVADIDLVIGHLQALKAQAQAVLPESLGGSSPA